MKEMNFKKLNKTLREATGLDKNNQWEILRDFQKNYFYIGNNSEVLCDEDGNPYHFDTKLDAENFLISYSNPENESLIEDVKLTHGHSGFGLVGKNSEVTTLLKKLVSKYGNLTIPEFIDVLIQKEQKGENTLKDMLTESLASDKLEKFRQLLGTTNSGNSRGTYAEVPLHFDLLDPTEFYFDYKGSGLSPEFTFNIDTLKALQEDRKKFPKMTDTKTFWDNSGMVKAIVNKLRQLEDVTAFCGWEDYTIHDTNYIFSFSMKIYLEENLTEQIEYIYHCLKVADKAALEYYKNVKLPNIQQEITEKDSEKQNTLSKRFEVLRLAKAEADKNTTVKQALSKSAVAKKIRELQNPTPEQLAKILAAIEGGN